MLDTVKYEYLILNETFEKYVWFYVVLNTEYIVFYKFTLIGVFIN